MYKIVINEGIIDYAYNDFYFPSDPNIPEHGKVVCGEQAAKSGLSFQGKPIDFKLTDAWGIPLDGENLFAPYYGEHCMKCGMRLACNGCSRCRKCTESD